MEKLPFLVIGRTGQLARALSGSDDVIAIGRDELDLSWDVGQLTERLDEIIARRGPFCGLIIAAAWTAVDLAETETDTARAVNATAVGAIANVCANSALPLVHISTDYVFNGQAHSPYAPDYPTDPLNAYGQTKREGEMAIEASGAKYAILRTSWVYAATGKNFMNTMLRLAQTRNELGVVDDQVGRPTYAPDLADAARAALAGLMGGALSGIYHVSNTGKVISWADFARAIFSAADLSVTVKGIPGSDYPTPAARPAYSAMDTSSFEDCFQYDLPDWQDGLKRAIASRGNA